MLTVIENVHWRRMSIRLGLLSILIWLASCQTPVGVSGSYKPTIPILAAPPLESAYTTEMRGRTIHLQSRRWFIEVDVPSKGG